MATKDTVQYWLVASGKMTTPRLNISVWELDDFRAIKQAKKVVEQLTQAGYYSFELFEGEDRRVRRFTVETTVEVKEQP